MKITPLFYTEWTLSAQRMSRKITVLQMPEFVRDVLGIVDEFVAAFISLPINGKVKPFKVLTWALSKPDPLEDVRNQMDLVRKKWGF